MSEGFPGIRAGARIGLEIEIAQRRYRACCGSDYLGLARDPRVIEAAQDALARYGISPSASRVTSGETAAHRACEETSARFFGTEDAVLLPLGYLAAQAMVEALEPARTWHAHARAHASLKQAAAFAAGSGRGAVGSTWSRPAELRALSREAASGALADALFPAPGELLPLRDVHDALRASSAPLVLDEAHAFGVLGPLGRGHAASCGLGEADGVHVVGTLSKAFGSYGGIAPASRALCEAIRSRAALYVGATPVPAAMAAASAVAIEIARNEPERLARLRSLSASMRAGLLALGLPAPDEGVPVFALSSGIEPARAQRALMDAGYFAPHSHYPGSPPSGALAIALSAMHEPRDVERLLEVLAACRNAPQ